MGPPAPEVVLHETSIHRGIRVVERNIDHDMDVLRNLLHHERTRKVSHGIGGAGNYRKPFPLSDLASTRNSLIKY
jgi:hypothetical protein